MLFSFLLQHAENFLNPQYHHTKMGIFIAGVNHTFENTYIHTYIDTHIIHNYIHIYLVFLIK